MSCEYVRELISLSLDGQLPAQELEKMSAHLRACRQCSSSLATGQELRSAMRTMPLLLGGAVATALTGLNIGELRDRAKQGAQAES